MVSSQLPCHALLACFALGFALSWISFTFARHPGSTQLYVEPSLAPSLSLQGVTWLRTNRIERPPASEAVRSPYDEVPVNFGPFSGVQQRLPELPSAGHSRWALFTIWTQLNQVYFASTLLSCLGLGYSVWALLQKYRLSLSSPPSLALLHTSFHCLSTSATVGSPDWPKDVSSAPDMLLNVELFRDCGKRRVEELAYAESQFAVVTPKHPELGSLTPVNVHYQVAGDVTQGKGTKALLLHGFGANSVSWHNVQQNIAGLFGSCTAMDMPGFGLTERPRWGTDFVDRGQQPLRNPYTTSATAELCAEFSTAVLQCSENEKLILVGHSFGGLISSLVALRCPELIQGLVLICPALQPKLPPSASQSFLRAPFSALGRLLRFILWVPLLAVRYLWAKLCHLLVVNPIAKWFLRRAIFGGKPSQGYGPTIFDLVLPKAVWADQPFSGRTRILDGYKRPIKAQDFDTGVLEFTAAAMIHGRAPVDLEQLSKVNCLVISGENDQIVPPKSCQKLAAILKCPYVEIAGSGHCPMEDKPDEVMRAIRQWVSTTS